MSLSNKKVNCLIVRYWMGTTLWFVFDFVSNHRLLPRQILNCPVCKLGGFCTARSRCVRQEMNQALMSAVSKNLLISFFVRSVVPVVAETMLKTAGLIHQNGYEEIFKFTECRHGTRNLVESSAGKAKGPDRKVWTLVVSLSAFQNV